MNEDERSTHFQGYAHLLLPELERLFLTLYARISELRPIEEIDAVEDEIRALLAQRGYDLVLHTLDNIWEVHNPEMLIEKTPDLTAWPEQEGQS